MSQAARACLLFALHREARPLLRRFPNRRRLKHAPCNAWRILIGAAPLIVLETGIGAQRSLRALAWITGVLRSDAEDEARPLVVSAGFAGALNERLQAGDVLAPRDVIDANGSRWATTHPPCFANANQRLPDARAITLDRLVTTPAEKKSLRAASGADIVDMESAVVAAYCAEHRLRFGCARCVSDDAATGLSPELAQILSAGRVAPRLLLKRFLRSPRLIGEAWRLRGATENAARALAEFLAKMLTLELCAA